MPHLRDDIANNIATITLTNPPQNRIGVQMVTELEAATDAMAHGDARVLLVRAEGPDFSFGGDISTWPRATSHDLRAVFEGYLSVYNRFERLPIPTIAAVQGRCLGGGFELVLRCDIILAAQSSTIGRPEQTLGITTLMGGIYRVAERAGRAFATELGFTSQTVAAEVMEAHGIVNRVVTDDALNKEADAFVERLATGPTRAHAAHKALLRLRASGGLQAADDALFDISMPLFETEDTKMALRSAVDALSRGQKRPILSFLGR